MDGAHIHMATWTWTWAMARRRCAVAVKLTKMNTLPQREGPSPPRSGRRGPTASANQKICARPPPPLLRAYWRGGGL